MNSHKKNVEFIKKYLDEDGWRYEMEKRGDLTVFTGSVNGFDGAFDSFQFIMFVREEVKNYAVFPLFAKDRQAEMAEFITRINYGLKYGGFEMNYDNGCVRFRLAFPMTAIRADKTLLPMILLLPPRILDLYSNGFMEVLMGCKSPVDAIKDCMRA